jgi:hypothetical protein
MPMPAGPGAAARRFPAGAPRAAAAGDGPVTACGARRAPQVPPRAGVAPAPPRGSRELLQKAGVRPA